MHRAKSATTSSPVLRIVLVAILLCGFLVVYTLFSHPTSSHDETGATNYRNSNAKKKKMSKKKPYYDRNSPAGDEKEHNKQQQNKNNHDNKKIHAGDLEGDQIQYQQDATLPPINRKGDDVPAGQGKVFDEKQIEYMKDMIKYARENDMPDPFPNIHEDDLDQHIRDHKEEKVDAIADKPEE